ncbi:MHC class I polypeptide-related sequence B-like [Sapajus apella]|uniref:MHC class I polypeptide-related sequence B-like n=1 Tax=Sapajus apella TaxID=9515 RepID=A0A6J3H341_SAPAP|nr:MHC class I polypeptide-related sequence B-like [Sapajus apella]
MGLGRVLLFLAIAFPLTLLGAAAEPHSLRYNLTVLSRDGSVQSGFLAVGYLDGQLFLLCDRQKCPAGPQGQWEEAVRRAEPWHTEIEDLIENEKNLKMTLAHIKGKKGALYSLQEIRLCEINEDGSTKGVRRFYYDGELFLSQNLDTQEWTVHESSRAQILSINIMNVLKENVKKAGTVRADCRQKLQGYLESLVCVGRTVPPMVNVTRSEDSEGNINVTCWASGFYPPNITLTWRQHGVSLSHNDQQSEGVLPDGNGTYQIWVTISIRQGEEQRFTCYMEHSGNHSTHPVPPGKVLVLESQRTASPHVPAAAAPAPAPAIIAGIIAVAIIVFSIVHCIHHCKKKRTSPAEGPELMSLQVLDQHVVGTGDHRDAAQLGFQPLISAPGPTGSTQGTETLQPGG